VVTMGAQADGMSTLRSSDSPAWVRCGDGLPPWHRPCRPDRSAMNPCEERIIWPLGRGGNFAGAQAKRLTWSPFVVPPARSIAAFSYSASLTCR